MHMLRFDYPLSIAHHYEITAKMALEFTKGIALLTPHALSGFAGLEEARAGSIPFANMLLKRLIEESGVSSVLFSAYGVREGFIYDRLPDSLKAEDPLIAACRNLAEMTGRATADGDALFRWMSPAFVDETPEQSRLRRAACLLADLEWSEHPDYRAEHALLRILRYPLIGIDHVHAHRGEDPRNAELGRERHRGAGRLLAVAQGGIEQDDTVGGGGHRTTR